MTQRTKRIDASSLPNNLEAQLSSKSAFIKRERHHQISPWQSSDELMDSVERNIDEIATFIDDESSLQKIQTNINLVALDTGVLPSYKGSETEPYNSSLQEACYVYLIEKVKLAAKTSFSNSGVDLGIKFNLTSSVGIIAPDSSPMSTYNCAHDVESKVKIINYAQTCASELLSQPYSIGNRVQLENWTKAGTRAATLLTSEDKLVETTVTNDYHGQRVRAVNGMSLTSNLQQICMNAYVMDGLDDFLKNLWKFTPTSLLERTSGKFISTFDVVNNDQTYNIITNDRIHKDLLSTEMYETWRDIQFNQKIYGVYRDSMDKEVLYQLEGYKVGLLSGEGLTSLINKIGHTTTQLVAWFTTLGVTSPTDEDFLLASTHIINNGDDLLMIHDTQLERDKCSNHILESTFANYELEDLIFSGFHFQAKNDVGPIYNASSSFAALFFGLLQRERRNYDNKALGTLPFNSLLGRSQWILQYPPGDEVTTMAAVDLMFRVAGFDGTLDDLTHSAEEELLLASLEGDDRAAAIATLTKLMGLKSSSELWYNYSYEEMYAADPEAAQLLFLRLPSAQVLRKSTLDYLGNL